MRPLKTHTFRGTTYEIDIGDEILYGRCEGRKNTKNPKMGIYIDLQSKIGLETCIHEALHACCFAKTEEIVTSSAKDIARFLWRLGYRKVK